MLQPCGLRRLGFRHRSAQEALKSCMHYPRASPLTPCGRRAAPPHASLRATSPSSAFRAWWPHRRGPDDVRARILVPAPRCCSACSARGVLDYFRIRFGGVFVAVFSVGSHLGAAALLGCGAATQSSDQDSSGTPASLSTDPRSKATVTTASAAATRSAMRALPNWPSRFQLNVPGAAAPATPGTPSTPGARPQLRTARGPCRVRGGGL